MKYELGTPRLPAAPTPGTARLPSGSPFCLVSPGVWGSEQAPQALAWEGLEGDMVPDLKASQVK